MVKMIAERSTFLARGKDGKEHFRAQLIADDSAELVGVTGQGDKVFEFGSIALTADGEACMLKSDGTWHKLSDGSEVE